MGEKLFSLSVSGVFRKSISFRFASSDPRKQEVFPPSGDFSLLFTAEPSRGH